MNKVVIAIVVFFVVFAGLTLYSYETQPKLIPNGEPLSAWNSVEPTSYLNTSIAGKRLSIMAFVATNKNQPYLITGGADQTVDVLLYNLPLNGSAQWIGIGISDIRANANLSNVTPPRQNQILYTDHYAPIQLKNSNVTVLHLLYGYYGALPNGNYTCNLVILFNLSPMFGPYRGFRSQYQLNFSYPVELD